MFESKNLAKNADPDKYKCSDCNIGFDSRSEFSLTDGSLGNNAITFGVWAPLWILITKIKILGKGQTQELDNATLTVKAKYSVNFWKPQRKICASLHYNGNNSFLFVNATKYVNLKKKALN